MITHALQMLSQRKRPLRAINSVASVRRVGQGQWKMGVLSLHKLFGAVCFISCLAATSAYGYSFIQISTAAPTGLESQFIAATTTQFNAKVVANPLASNTYAITLYGLNPSYVTPSTATCFNIAVDIDTTSLQSDLNVLVNAGPQIIRDPYIYGYAAGEENQNSVDEHLGFYMTGLCHAATNYTVINATATWDPGTCMDTLNTYVNNLYELNLSTPPVIAEPF